HRAGRSLQPLRVLSVLWALTRKRVSSACPAGFRDEHTKTRNRRYLRDVVPSWLHLQMIDTVHSSPVNQQPCYVSFDSRYLTAAFVGRCQASGRWFGRSVL